eukprot:g20755.t1
MAQHHWEQPLFLRSLRGISARRRLPYRSSNAKMRRQTWINGECVGCGAGTIVLWVFFMVLFFLTLPAVYYAGNQPVVAKVSIRQTIGMSVGLVVALLQTLGETEPC